MSTAQRNSCSKMENTKFSQPRQQRRIPMHKARRLFRARVTVVILLHQILQVSLSQPLHSKIAKMGVQSDEQFSHSYGACCSDPCDCLYSCCCLPCAYGGLREDMGESWCVLLANLLAMCLRVWNDVNPNAYSSHINSGLLLTRDPVSLSMGIGRWCRCGNSTR
jgi:hypothetical protein